VSESMVSGPDSDPPTDPTAGAPAPCRGNAGKGRPKGSLNKVTLAARETILLAAERLGGVDGLVAWARKSDENERIFWSVIYPKVLAYGGGPSTSAVAAVTGALVWRRPEPEPPAPATAFAAAEVAAAAADGAAAIATADAATMAATADAAAAGPPPVAATVVWRAPAPGATGGLPGLPGGPAVDTAGDGRAPPAPASRSPPGDPP